MTKSAFDALVDELDMAQRTRDHGLMTKALSDAHAAGVISGTDACRADLLLRQGRAPQELRDALLKAAKATTDEGDDAGKPKVAIKDIRPPLAHLAEQRDTRRRLALARDAGALSKGMHQHYCGLLDNGKRLPPEIEKSLSAIDLGEEGTDDGEPA